MNRTDILLQGLDPHAQVAIEIGALDKPVVPPSGRAFFVDHMDTPSLRLKYKDDPGVDAEKIVDVRGVWGSSTLAEIAKAVAPVDFIVASHVVEHVPDLITWLGELHAALKPGGEVRLAVPDQRYTFDRLRRPSSASDVLAAYAVKARVPQPAQVVDFAMNMASVDCGSAWDGRLPEVLKAGYPQGAELQLAREAAAGQYHDVHCWVFTPASFAQLMEILTRRGLVQFACSMFADTQPYTFEFFVGLQACTDPDAAAESWAVLAARAQAVDAMRAQQERDREFLADPRWIGAWERMAEAERTIAAMKASTSWRVTAPLRAALDWLRRSA